MKGENSVDAVCPFYSSDGSLKVICEGLIDDSNTIHEFKSKEAAAIFFRKYCCDNFAKCPFYKILEAKYGNA